MNNIFFQYLLRYWPILVAISITILLIYQKIRPKISPEKIQKGILKQNILLTLDDDLEIEPDPEQKEWLVIQKKLEKYFSKPSQTQSNTPQLVDYKSQITISLIWSLFWIGVDTFLVIRICINPYYYLNEAYFLSWFTYYVIIGLISYFRR